MRDFAELINDLFNIYRKPDGNEYTNKEVAQHLGCDPSYLAKLRRGTITNPGRDTLLNLCYFFNVKPSYFFPELGEETTLISPDQQMEAALRSSGFNEQQRGFIKNLLDMFKKGQS